MALITTEEDLKEVVQQYLDAGLPFAFDTETMGENRLDPFLAPVIWLSLCNRDRSDVIPMGHPNGAFISERLAPNKKGRERMARGIAYEDLNPKYDLSVVEKEYFFEPPPEQLDRAVAMPILEPLFKSSLLKIAHNAKFDIHGMGKYFEGGIEGPFFDTLIASWLFDSRRLKAKMLGQPGLGLKDCVQRELGEVMEKGVGENIANHSFEEVAKYSILDSEYTYDVYESLVRKMSPTLKWLMDLEMAVLHPVLEMEDSGVVIDKEVLRELSDEIEVEIRDLEAWFHKYAGRPVNMRSPAQRQELLFRSKDEGGLGIRSAKLTKGGEAKQRAGLATTIYDMSTDSSVLEAHRGKPLVDKMLEYSDVVKLYGTYVLPYLGGTSVVGASSKVVESQLRNGRVYGEFKQSGTESGRFSSSNPNLQNIPSRTPRGRRIRDAFIANPGEILVVADYSQIEPRIIASLSGDPTMIEAYRKGEDVYQTIADRMGVTRAAGKTLVLAIAYGVGPTKIATDIGCSMTDARDLMDFFSRSHPKIDQHKRDVLQQARRNGYSETIFGRRRVLDIRSRDEAIRKMAERQAYNHLIQGTAADIMKIALVNIHSSLPDEATMLMTVHDEVVVTTPYDLVEEVEGIVRDEMEGACPSRHITVPLVAEVKSGYRWSDCK